MNNYRFKKWYLLATLVVIAALIKLATFYPAWIEHSYVPKIYRPVAGVMRTVFGWVPFSIGDIFYAVLIILLLLNLFVLARNVVNRKITGARVKASFYRTLVYFLVIYIFFNLSWGLNYNRLGIAYQLGLETTEYSVKDLKLITAQLVDKVNERRKLFKDSIITLPDYAFVFNKSVAAYDNAVKKFSFLRYNPRSLKKSNFGRLGNYLGFLGYYNPFTGEAQVNLTIPRFVIPYVSCHEIAHQLGYASESEANFVGYLAATNSTSVLYQYSAYFDLFRYANYELARFDTVSSQQNFNRLDSKVKGDYYQIKEYLKKTRSPFEPIIKVFYDYYLKANQQQKGVYSYNEVVGWLIAYKKKFGTI